MRSLCGSRNTTGNHNTTRFSTCSVERFGGHSGGETPGPIPNPEVKPSSADGTAPGTVWESRTPPDINIYREEEKNPPPKQGVRVLLLFPIFMPEHDATGALFCLELAPATR